MSLLPPSMISHHLVTFQQPPQAAFWKLKESFTSAPILPLLDSSLQFVGEVDVSNGSFGAVLSQNFNFFAVLQ